ncbi:MAG: complex I NDUFA9 subunit family protein [Gemmatimonadota bacterium]
MILVTGATGFVGSEILRRASRRGWRVRGLSRRPDRAEALGRLPHVELFRGDAADPGDLDEAMAGVTRVIHLVGIIVETERQSFAQAHVATTEAVLAAAERSGVARYVHMSALGVEAGRELGDYFRTKWAAEEAVRASGLAATIFRPSLIFGAGDALTNRLARIIRWSPAVPLPGGGATRLQPVWVGDVAECFLQAARADRTPAPRYDVAGPEVLTLREIVQTLAQVMGRRRLILPLPVGPLKLGAAVAETVLPAPPVTREQLNMLALDNVSTGDALRALRRDFEIEHPRLATKAPEWLQRKE